MGNCKTLLNSKWQCERNSKAKIGGIHVQVFGHSPLANLKNWNLSFISKFSCQFEISVEVPFKQALAFIIS